MGVWKCALSHVLYLSDYILNLKSTSDDRSPNASDLPVIGGLSPSHGGPSASASRFEGPNMGMQSNTPISSVADVLARSQGEPFSSAPGIGDNDMNVETNTPYVLLLTSFSSCGIVKTNFEG